MLFIKHLPKVKLFILFWEKLRLAKCLKQLFETKQMAIKEEGSFV